MTMVWCPGHCDIVNNDLADEEAKKADEELSNVHEASSDTQSVSVGSEENHNWYATEGLATILR